MYMMMKVPRGSLEDELFFVCRELDAQPSAVYVPRLLIKLGLQTIRIAENSLSIDCGPTAGIDAAFSARNRVSEDGRATVGWMDIRSAISAAVSTNREKPEHTVPADSIDALIPDIAGFLQQELAGIDLALLIGTLHASIGTTGEISPENLKKLITGTQPGPALEQLSAWVVQHEKTYNFRIYDVIAEYLKAYQLGIAQLKKARGRLQ